MSELFVQKQIQKLAQKINQPQQFVKELALLFNFWGNEKVIAESKRTIPNISSTYAIAPELSF